MKRFLACLAVTSLSCTVTAPTGAQTIAVCDPSACASGICDAATDTCAVLECEAPKMCPACQVCAEPIVCEMAQPRCTATPTDSCTAGKYCDTTLDACRDGCRGDSDCPLGHCNTTTHACDPCKSDLDCAGEDTCVAGACVAACSSNTPCAAGSLCCGGQCVVGDTTLHCGGCQRACTANQFCAQSTCTTLSLSKICDLPIVVVHDGLAGHDSSANVIVAGLGASCPVPPPVTTTTVADLSALAADGEPVWRANSVYLFAGTKAQHKGIRWLDRLEGGVTKVLAQSTPGGVVLATIRATGVHHLEIDPIYLSAGHGFFIIELVRDSRTGAPVLLSFALNESAVAAAAWYLVTYIIPLRASFPGGYYVVEWLDQNADNSPDAGDAFGIHLHD